MKLKDIEKFIPSLFFLPSCLLLSSLNDDKKVFNYDSSFRAASRSKIPKLHEERKLERFENLSRSPELSFLSRLITKTCLEFFLSRYLVEKKCSTWEFVASEKEKFELSRFMVGNILKDLIMWTSSFQSSSLRLPMWVRDGNFRWKQNFSPGGCFSGFLR